MPPKIQGEDIDARLTTHEAICAERYTNIMDTLKRIDQRTESHAAAIQTLNTQSNQFTGAWKTMVAIGIIIGIVGGLIKLTGVI